jgi:DNA invertase Pin-like site-specific DNA recombinase
MRRRSLPLAAYVRVSTAAQASSGLGLEAQRRAIREAADAGTFEVGSWHEDAGYSGASMSRRPALAVLAEVKSGTAGGIVVARIDRLGRSSADVLGLVERAQREGWRLLALDVGLDSATPAGELVAAALAMAARFEWRRISERQQEKFTELRRQGRARGRASAPREVADLIIGLREAGSTWQAIADMLNGQKVPTPRGGSAWRPSSVRSADATRRRELDAQQS